MTAHVLGMGRVLLEIHRETWSALVVKVAPRSGSPSEAPEKQREADGQAPSWTELKPPLVEPGPWDC